MIRLFCSNGFDLTLAKDRSDGPSVILIERGRALREPRFNCHQRAFCIQWDHRWDHQNSFCCFPRVSSVLLWSCWGYLLIRFDVLSPEAGLPSEPDFLRLLNSQFLSWKQFRQVHGIFLPTVRLIFRWRASPEKLLNETNFVVSIHDPNLVAKHEHLLRCDCRFTIVD